MSHRNVLPLIKARARSNLLQHDLVRTLLQRGIGIVAYLVVAHLAEQDAHRQVVLILARHLAGLAAGADVLIVTVAEHLSYNRLPQHKSIASETVVEHCNRLVECLGISRSHEVVAFDETQFRPRDALGNQTRV